MKYIKILNNSTLDIGITPTQEDVTYLRTSLLKREISLNKPIGFELSVHGQKATDYLLERGQTSLEALHEISLKLSKITFLKTGNPHCMGQLPKGQITTSTLCTNMASAGHFVQVLEKDQPLFTLRNPASMKIFLQYKAGEHSIAQSASKLKSEASAYICQPDFTLANHLLISPQLQPDGTIRCTILSDINISYLETLLTEHFINKQRPQSTELQ